MLSNLEHPGFHLLLVRHGESTNNAGPPQQRVPDTPLTDLGWAQARRLGPRLSDLQSTGVLLASPFLRTLQTTEPIAQATGLTPLIRTDLHETGGCYAGYHPDERVGKPGMNADEIATQFPDYRIPADIDESGWWKSQTPETGEQAAARARNQLALLRTEYVGSDVVVACVAHGDFIMLMLTAALDHWPGHTKAPIPNTSVTHLLIDPDGAQLVADRATGHLEAEQISF